MKYSEAIEMLANKVIEHFDEVYYGAEIVISNGQKIPAVTAGDEWVDLGPDQSKEIIYIRRDGDDMVEGEYKLGGCGRQYKMVTPLRIVFFRDHESFHDQILVKLLKIALSPRVRLRSITRDKFKLLKQETTIEHDLGASTAYFAVDVNLVWDLLPESCDESDLCITIDNPLRKCSTINNNS